VVHSVLSLIICILASQNVTSLCRYPQLILTKVHFPSSLFESRILCQTYSSETNIEQIQISSTLCRHKGKFLQVTFPQTHILPFRLTLIKPHSSEVILQGVFHGMVTELIAICCEDNFFTDIILFCLACVQSDRNCLKVV